MLLFSAEVLLIQQPAQQNPLFRHAASQQLFLFLQFVELFVGCALLRGEFGELAVTVADCPFGITQRIGGFGL